MQLNASRIKVLQAQDDVVSSMKEDAAKELLHVSHNHHVYKHLLKDLIVQVGIRITHIMVYTAYKNFICGSFFCLYLDEDLRKFVNNR